MKRVLLIILTVYIGLAPARVFAGCEDSVAAEAAPLEFVLSASAATGVSAEWANHLDFIRVLGIVPDEVRLSASHGFVSLGEQDPAAFKQALRVVLKNPGANLMLRVLGHWCGLIAQFYNHPEWAGDLFASLLNRSSLQTEVSANGQVALKPMPLPKMFSKLGFESFPVLKDLVELVTKAKDAEGRPAEDVILALAFNGMNTVSGLLQGEELPYRVALMNTSSAVSFFDPSFAGFTERWDPGISVSTEFRSADEVSMHKVSVVPNGRSQNKPVFLFPSLGGELPLTAEAWTVRVLLDGAPQAGYLAVPEALGNRLQEDLLLLERVAFPLLVRAQAYELGAAAQMAMGGQPAPRRMTPIGPERGPRLSGNALRDRAIAYAMLATVALFEDSRAARVTDLLLRIIRRDERGELSVADFERIARRAQLPIYFVANPTTALGTTRAWPPGKYYATMQNKPSHVLYAHIGTPVHVAQCFAQWRLDEQSNLELLENQTGISIAQDPMTN